MSVNADWRYEDDKRKREQRSRRVAREWEEFRQRMSELEEAQEMEKAKANYDKYERPFDEEVASRLAEYQNTKTTKRG